MQTRALTDGIIREEIAHSWIEMSVQFQPGETGSTKRINPSWQLDCTHFVPLPQQLLSFKREYCISLGKCYSLELQLPLEAFR